MTHRWLIIAGPNGAGKSTTAHSLIHDLGKVNVFINADDIAKELCPDKPESIPVQASKLMLQRLKSHLLAKSSFALETTASGSNYLKYIKEAQAKGYEVSLLFLWLSSPELAIKRVSTRVAQGGHHVPEETIRRRYKKGIKNIVNEYLPVVNTALFIDNSLLESGKAIIRKNEKDHLIVENEAIWQEIQGYMND